MVNPSLFQDDLDTLTFPAGYVTNRGAQFSACRRFRYSLWRTWGEGPTVMFVGLNPSTADALLDDPTIRRCMNFARGWGYSGMVMTNLFAWRATNPRDMLAAEDPIGAGNDAMLVSEHQKAALTVAAWGAHGGHQGRDQAVRALLPRLHYLRLTKDGYPGHPLYLPGTLSPQEWAAASTPSGDSKTCS